MGKHSGKTQWENSGKPQWENSGEIPWENTVEKHSAKIVGKSHTKRLPSHGIETTTSHVEA